MSEQFSHVLCFGGMQTFPCLNLFSKVNPEVEGFWSRIHCSMSNHYYSCTTQNKCKWYSCKRKATYFDSLPVGFYDSVLVIWILTMNSSEHHIKGSLENLTLSWNFRFHIQFRLKEIYSVQKLRAVFHYTYKETFMHCIIEYILSLNMFIVILFLKGIYKSYRNPSLAL